jgi:diguanylate cyclase (GGDEF)-like protein
VSHHSTLSADFPPGPLLEAPARAGDGSDKVADAREIDALLAEGRIGLSLPAALEARFLADGAARRLRVMVLSGLAVGLLFNWLLLSDWMMVPDQFEQALKLRLFVFCPSTLVGVYLITKVPSPVWREWSMTLLGITASALNTYLCMASSDPLAGPYLVNLTVIVVFANSVSQMRFVQAAVMNVCVVLMFIAGAIYIDGAPLPVMLPSALVLISAGVFTLYGCYRLECDERHHWLMLLRESLLLEEIAQANAHLDTVSRSDMLTEVANRRHFDEFLQVVWNRACQDGSDISIMMIDVDHFKAFNDRYGHPAGDACLKDIASTLKRRLRRPGDLIARFGGEEFIVILGGTPLATACSAAERVRRGVENLNLLHATSSTHAVVTVSIGVACLRPNSPYASPAQLISAADEALYHAKARGRNRVFAFGTND